MAIGIFSVTPLLLFFWSFLLLGGWFSLKLFFYFLFGEEFWYSFYHNPGDFLFFQSVFEIRNFFAFSILVVALKSSSFVRCILSQFAFSVIGPLVLGTSFCFFVFCFCFFFFVAYTIFFCAVFVFPFFPLSGNYLLVIHNPFLAFVGFFRSAFGFRFFSSFY